MKNFLKNKYLILGGIFFFIFLFPSISKAAFSCDSGTLSDTCTVSSTKTLSDSETVSGSGNIVVASGGNITAAATYTTTITMSGDITIQSGGTITANSTITAANLNINSGGSINVNGKGYPGGASWTAGQGPGAGGGGYNGGGGGFGGAGGCGRFGGSCSGAAGATNGSSTSPDSLGSGGGGANYGGQVGGAGGGKIKLVISGTLTVGGTISANGSNGSGNTWDYFGGGGSGGSIWIKASNMAGSATMSANGGNANATTSGGGGGGGRIAYYYSNKTYSGSVTVTAGTGNYSGSAGTTYSSTLPYVSSGTFTSSVIDTGQASSFTTLDYTKTTPADTTLTVDIRAGNTATPDETWTDWQTDISDEGSISALNGNRYVQYRANLAGDTSATPSLDDVTVNYVYYPLASTSTSNVNFTTEGEYTQEDSNTGTDFSSGKATLATLNTSLVATGGTMTTSGGYTIHTFTSSGTLSVSSGGDVDYLVVGGGGGGGADMGAGGGAGGFLTGSLSLSSGDKTVTVGDGGDGGYSSGGYQYWGYNGENSVFDSITATGGGGGPHGTSGARAGTSGGSGSGGTRTGAAGTGTVGQGHDGGVGQNSGDYYGGGGGGGASTAASGSYGSKDGGTGTASSISGSSVTYAGGGGGGSMNTSYGTGGSGGGGRGGSSSVENGTSGTVNTGGGGGGAGRVGGDLENMGGNGGSGIVIVRYPINTTYYPTSQAYYITTSDSSQVDTSTYGYITDVDITQTTPANTSIKYLVSFDDRSTWKYWDGDSWETSTLDNLQTYGMSKETLEGIGQSDWESSGGFVAGSGTLDFAVDLSSTDSAVAPEVDNIAVNYEALPASLTSSKYNTGSSTNTMVSVNWTETLPANTDAKFQIQTSANGTDWSGWKGPDGTSGTYFTAPDGTGESMPAAFADTSNDQYFQYKVFLSTSDASQTPTVSDITVTYAVNAPPEFNSGFGTNGVNVSQISDSGDANWGKVKIEYAIKDIDTDTEGNTTRNYITPTFEYTLNGGSNWYDISLSNITFGSAPSGGDIDDVNTDGKYDNKVLEDSYLTYTAYWDAKTAIDGNYSANFQVRVKIDDNEAANRYATAIGNTTSIDTDDPVAGAHPVLVSAITSPAGITLSASDDSTLKMEVNLDNDFSSVLADSYSASTTIALSTDPDTVYAKFQDIYGNATSVYSATTPETPTAVMIQDTTNMDTDPEEYRLFVAWQTIVEASPAFSQYKIYRSTDGSSYSPFTTVDSRTTNYYGDSSVEYDTDYYYKIATLDANGNISYFSSAVHGKANGDQDEGEGGGGGDTTAPVISAVSISNITSSGATVTWTTNELATSTVGYSTTAGNFNTELGVAGYVTGASHSVALTGLSAETTYYLKIKSMDASYNLATDSNGGDGYSFETAAASESGPNISDISSGTPLYNSATITWTTDEEADSFVEYSTENGFSHGTFFGNETDTTSHSVFLGNLSASTTYYYKVHSTDTDGNETISSQNSFATSAAPDTTSPIVSDISSGTPAGTTATITWTTNENTDSIVEYGTTTEYTLRAGDSSDSDTSHSVSLSGLSYNTTYHFRINSRDASGNSVRSDDQTFVTLADTAEPSISSVSAEVISYDKVIITWTTNEFSTSQISYGKTTALGSSTTIVSSTRQYHYVILTDLDANTKYYYKAKSKDSSDNEAISAEYNFTTLKNPEYQHDALSAISSISDPPTVLTDTKAVISFNTDQNALCAIEYGTATGNYNEVPVAEASYNRNHAIHVPGLVFSTAYYYRILCEDNLDNVVNSVEKSFTTLETQIGESEAGDSDATAPEISSLSTGSLRGESVTITWKTDEEANSLVKYGTTTDYGSMAGNDIVNSDTAEYLTDHEVIINGLTPGTKYYFMAMSIDESGNIGVSSEDTFTTKSPSTLSSIKVVSTSLSQVTITWTTDINTTSIVEYGLETTYGSSQQSSTMTKSHEVSVSSLKTGEIYHFRVKGEDEDGNLYSSGDYTFQPKSPPVISGIKVGTVSENTATIIFTTDIPTDVLITYTDPANAKNSGSQGKPDLVSSHTVEISNLEAGVKYNFKIKVRDELGNETESEGGNFTTTKDENAPKIESVKTSAALSQNDIVQTIISWDTDELATASITYRQGTNGEEKEKIIDENPTLHHLAVITDFKPGEVYHFRVKSVDKSGNETSSEEYAFLAPQKKENVVQFIVMNFQSIFSWTGFGKK